MALDRGNIRVLGRIARYTRLPSARVLRARPTDKRFDLAHRQVVPRRPHTEQHRIRMTDQGAGMAHRQFRFLDEVEHGFGKLEQSLQVGDVAARLVYQRGDFGLAHAFRFGELGIGPALLDRVEILALQVLDQSQRHDLALVELAYKGGDFVQARFLRRTPAPLTRYELVATATEWADDDRLDHP